MLPRHAAQPLGAPLMFAWFRRNKDRKTESPSREAILNKGLHLAMEWGEHWLKPIQARLGSKYPTLAPAELDELNALCQAAMRFGHSTVYDMASVSGKDTKYEDFEPVMTQRYPWVDSRNLSRLFSQGMYYAWKDMGFA